MFIALWLTKNIYLCTKCYVWYAFDVHKCMWVFAVYSGSICSLTINPNNCAGQLPLRRYPPWSKQRNLCTISNNRWLTAENADYANGSNELYTMAHNLAATSYTFSRGLWTDECKCSLFKSGWEDVCVILNGNWSYTHNSLIYNIRRKIRVCL